MGSNRMSITPERPIYSPFFSVMGATSAMVFSSMGAAYGTAKSGVGIAAMAIMKPELIMKSVVPVVMAGILAIYGVVVAVLIANTINKEGTTMAKDLTNMAAGFAIGIVGDAGVRGTAQQPKLFVGMVLMLIFAEVLGLYGLITALVMMYA